MKNQKPKQPDQTPIPSPGQIPEIVPLKEPSPYPEREPEIMPPAEEPDKNEPDELPLQPGPDKMQAGAGAPTLNGVPPLFGLRIKSPLLL